MALVGVPLSTDLTNDPDRRDPTQRNKEDLMAGNSGDFGFSAELITEYIDLANRFTSALSESLLPGIQVLFGAIVGLWLVISALRIAVAGHDLQEFGRDLIYVTIAFTLLWGQGPDLVNQIFQAALSVMGSAASIALNVGNVLGHQTHVPDGVNGLIALVDAAEQGIIAVVQQAVTIMGEGNWRYWLPYIYGLVLLIPFVLLILGYSAQVIVSIFRLVMIASISPFLMLSYGFGWGRGMALEGFKLMIGTFIVLYGATAAVGIILFGVRALDVGQGGGIESAADMFSQKEYGSRLRSDGRGQRCSPKAQALPIQLPIHLSQTPLRE